MDYSLGLLAAILPQYSIICAKCDYCVDAWKYKLTQPPEPLKQKHPRPKPTQTQDTVKQRLLPKRETSSWISARFRV